MAAIYRRFSGVLLLALVAASLGNVIGIKEPVTAQTTSCLAMTASGAVQGSLRGGTCTYYGVPYAAPPIGPLRWRPPQPRGPWAPASCPQP